MLLLLLLFITTIFTIRGSRSSTNTASTQVLIVLKELLFPLGVDGLDVADARGLLVANQVSDARENIGARADAEFHDEEDVLVGVKEVEAFVDVWVIDIARNGKLAANVLDLIGGSINAALLDNLDDANGVLFVIVRSR